MENYKASKAVRILQQTIDNWENQVSIFFEIRKCRLTEIEDIKGCFKLDLVITCELDINGKAKAIATYSPTVYITTLDNSILHEGFEIENHKLTAIMKTLDEDFNSAVAVSLRPSTYCFAGEGRINLLFKN